MLKDLVSNLDKKCKEMIAGEVSASTGSAMINVDFHSNATKYWFISPLLCTCSLPSSVDYTDNKLTIYGFK